MELLPKINDKAILVVGAGGIGCELLKNLVLSGFKRITVIDLDTIDVSNLNRQFLFRKEHVGKSKSKVAKESVEKFNPAIKIKAIHGSIMQDDYDVTFFQTFDLVLNALDNRAARNHVNRLCLAAGVPLVESGSAGYLGQVSVIIKGQSQCYECEPKQAQKSYPACTIRNTPSEPIHCVVWAKFLFNQLFGEEDPDQDVAPDTHDPELANNGVSSGSGSGDKNGANAMSERKSTRVWARETGYEASRLLERLFAEDIRYLLSMETLWKRADRMPPIPLSSEVIAESETAKGLDGSDSGNLRDQRHISLTEWCRVFRDSVTDLASQLSAKGEGGTLVWDKDDSGAMDFVAAAANIRMAIFRMTTLTRFAVKSMAGNIIPAIATTNAIVAGLIVLEAYKILAERKEACREVFLHHSATSRKKFVIPCGLMAPNPRCYVCASKPEVVLACRPATMSLRVFRDRVLIGRLGMVAPDVELDGKAVILISSEEGETDDNMEKVLSEFHVRSGCALRCDDFLQQYTLRVVLREWGPQDDNDAERSEVEEGWRLLGDVDQATADARVEEDANGKEEASNGDVVSLLDDEAETNVQEPKVPGKRKSREPIMEPGEVKRRRLEVIAEDEDDDLIMVD